MLMPQRANRQALMTCAFVTAFCFAGIFNGNAASPDSCGTEPRGSFRIAVDVGHGPDRPGATSARGIPEYYFNHRLVVKIAEALIASGFASTMVIRETGNRVGLVKRALRANALNADLLLSIHHDSVQDSYLKKWIYKGKQRLFSDTFSGFSVFVSRENVRFDDSLRFAIVLADALKANGMKFTLHHAENVPGERRELLDPRRGVYRYDQLIVLRTARMPAVLLEAGVIVNRDDELRLSSDAYRRSIAGAVTNAIADFCRTPPTAVQ